MSETSAENPRVVNVTYGGLAADIPLESDYVPAAFAKCFLLDTDAWVSQQAGREPSMIAPVLHPSAKLRLAGAVLGRLLKQTPLQDDGGRKHLDRERIQKLIDADYRNKIVTRKVYEPDSLRLVLLKSEIRMACAEVVRELFKLDHLSQNDNTSDVDLMASDAALSGDILDFIDDALGHLPDNIFRDSPSRERPLRATLVDTLSRRRRVDVGKGKLQGDDLVQELLYPLAQAASAMSWIKRGELYLAPRAVHDKFEKDEPSAVERLREVTAEYLRAFCSDEIGAKRIFNQEDENLSLWHLNENMVGRACDIKTGKVGPTDAYGVVEASDESYSRQVRLVNGNLVPMEEMHLVKALQTETRQFMPGHRRILEEEVNPLLFRVIDQAMLSGAGRSLVYARMRRTGTGEIDRWKAKQVHAPEGRVDTLAKIFDGMIRHILNEVRDLLDRKFDIPPDQLIGETV